MSTQRAFLRPLLATAPAVLLALALGWLLRGACALVPPPADAGDDAAERAEEPATVWTCSMHPQVRDDRPGLCPICSMDLVEVRVDEAAERPVLSLSPADQARLRLETTPVVRRDAAVDVRMSGKLALDETRISTISAWAGGRLERLFVDATGVDVSKGDHLVEIYSPELYATQAELLQVLALAEDDALARGLVQPARERLRQFGLTPQQIDAVAERGSASDTYTLYAPAGGVVMHRGADEGQWVERGTQIYTIADLSHLWVEIDAYERDLPWLRYGQDVSFETEAFPGKEFQGTIAFLSPVLDEHTRTVTVRVNVENHGRRLRPGMFVRTVVHARVGSRGQVLDPALAGKWVCTMHPEVIVEEPADCPVCGMDLVAAETLGLVPDPDEDAEPPLLVAATAPLLTGRRAVVYVEETDPEQGLRYVGREVVLGPRVGDWFVVLEGLAQGERVVVEGAFKLDAELQIRAKPSMMNPAEDTADVGSAPETSLEREADLPELRAALAGVWREYVALQLALADDDLAGARAAAEALASEAARVDASEYPEAEALHGNLHGDDGLHALATAIAAAETLEVARASFPSLSERLAALVRRYGVEGATVRRMECPMAIDGASAAWLQEDAILANPYLGRAMLRCGSELEVLQAEGQR